MPRTTTNLIATAQPGLSSLIIFYDSATANALASLEPSNYKAMHEGNWVYPVRRVDETFERILSMPPGWDGPGSARVSEDRANDARKALLFAQGLNGLLPDPAIVPCADGSLQFEWHLIDSRFEMYFEKDGTIGAWWHDLATNSETDDEGDQAYALLAQWAVRDGSWPVQAIAA